MIAVNALNPRYQVINTQLILNCLAYGGFGCVDVWMCGCVEVWRCGGVEVWRYGGNVVWQAKGQLSQTMAAPQEIAALSANFRFLLAWLKRIGQCCETLE